MADSIIEQIGAAIETRLETITTGNSYEFTIPDAIRPTRQGGYTPAQLKTVVTQGPHQGVADVPCGYEQWFVPFHCDVLNDTTATTPEAYDTLVNRWGSDVKKAMGTDLTLGNLALPTTMVLPANQILDENQQFEGARVTVLIEYRHLWDDPYSQ